jgi:hypothetical protein
VEHDAPALHATIVTASEDSTPVDEHGADGNPALGQTALGLLDCGSEVFVHAAIPLSVTRRDQITPSGGPRSARRHRRRSAERLGNDGQCHRDARTNAHRVRGRHAQEHIGSRHLDLVVDGVVSSRAGPVPR